MKNNREIKSIIVYVYNSYSDPLFKGNLLLILKYIGQKKDFIFHLITYEQEKYKISELEKNNVRKDLASYNIKWYPLSWHSGRFKLIKKMYDLLIGFIIITNLRFFANCNSIISLGTISGSFAFLISRVLRITQYAYQHEPHSEFMLDFGIWSKRNVSFILLNYLENLVGKYAEVISTGTDAMVGRLNQMKSKAKIFKFPSCVDEKRFLFNEQARKELRQKYNIGERPTLLYLGKFGGIYYDQEIIDLFSAIYQLDKTFYFIVVTPDDTQDIHARISLSGIPINSFSVTYADYLDVPQYISGSDIGLVAIPPYRSQKYRSPIKVGEYLCCGLPYIVCRGISEDDTYAWKYNVGVVVDSFSREEVIKAYGEILLLIKEDKQGQLKRCRMAGIEYRGLSDWLFQADRIFEHI